MQEFFIYNGKQKWTEDCPRRVMDEKGECYKNGIYFCAEVSSIGTTGIKYHKGTAYVCEFDDGTMKLNSVNVSCAAGTHGRAWCSGPRAVHDFTITGIATTTCKNKSCQKYDGTNLDKVNKTSWITVRTFYGLVPHNHHV